MALASRVEMARTMLASATTAIRNRSAHHATQPLALLGEADDRSIAVLPQRNPRTSALTCPSCVHGEFVNPLDPATRRWQFRALPDRARRSMTGFNHYADCGCGWCVNYGGRSRTNRPQLLADLRQRDAVNVLKS